MPVLGYTITSLNASRKTDASPKNVTQIDINSVPKIKGLKERKMTIPGMVENKDSLVVIDFEFETQYKPEIGSIRIAGELVYTGADNKKLLKDWDKSKKIPADTEIEVKNFLLRKCLLMGVDIAEEMQLPPPLSIPIIHPVAKDQKNPDYIG